MADEEKDKEENAIIEGVKQFLSKNIGNPGFKWFYGSRSFTAKELLEELDKDEKLRSFIIRKISKFACEQLTKGSK